MSNNSSPVNSCSNSANTVSMSLTRGSRHDSASFVVCGSCFWCATDLSGGSRIARCLACNEGVKIESIPLAPREKYTFDLDAKRGITLDFAPHK
jgi:hypothetical protein